jgi:hypothetical protein
VIHIISNSDIFNTLKGLLGVIAPSVIALCTSIKLSCRLVSRPCLEHPPKRSTVLAFRALYTGSWQCLNDISFHDLERNLLGCLFVDFFSAIFFCLFSLKAAFCASHHFLFPRTRPQTCLTCWAETQVGEPRYFLTADLIMPKSSFEYSWAEEDASCITSIGSFLFVTTLK